MKKLTIFYIAISIVAVCAAGYLLATYSYKQGYATGTKNQIICQAAEVQGSLKSLCNK